MERTPPMRSPSDSDRPRPDGDEPREVSREEAERQTDHHTADKERLREEADSAFPRKQTPDAPTQRAY